MKIEQLVWTNNKNWENITETIDRNRVQLVLVFGDFNLLNNTQRFFELQKIYPNAHILTVSSAGNIHDVYIEDQSIISTALLFEHQTHIEVQRFNTKNGTGSYYAGECIAKNLTKEGLKHILVFCDGLLVNGSTLVKGILNSLPSQVPITGGLAGDARLFKKTSVGIDAPPREGEIVAIGFYSEHLTFGFGSYGGWVLFGPERLITRSEENILYEIDDKPALDLYKLYLGEDSDKLPGSALIYPLGIRKNAQSPLLVRSITSFNEENKSIIFAGDVPQGYFAQLMHANFERLIDGASVAAAKCLEKDVNEKPALAILTNCVGRRVALGQRAEEELESVREIFGTQTAIIGFYSYGEIAPTLVGTSSELHNQTMTITTITEK